jgi:N-methylhydantoinase A
VTTAGFCDVLEIGRQARPRLYDLEPQREAPLVPRDLRLEIAERTLQSGEVERMPDAAAIESTIATLSRLRVDAVAVAFLHSYRNPATEIRVGDALAQAGFPVTLSHRVLREYREFERFAATAVNAFLLPVMKRYLEALASGAPGGLRVMRSNGGSISATAAAALPVQTILSGPAGGVAASAHLARLTGEERVLTFDMGGTSTDVSLLEGGPRLGRNLEVAGWPIRVPALDIHTVGAGGGSIAWADGGGALRVGPRSAGADPGPACYGRGEEPTVTDANLVLGFLRPDRFLGGAQPLDRARAHAAVARVGRSLGLTPIAAAVGIVRVAEAVMERALRVITIERGIDPRGAVLYCFGGAGGLHAASLARALGIRRVRVPAHPGLFSAFGMLASDIILDASETVLRPLVAAEGSGFDEVWNRLEREARERLAAERTAGEVRLERTADLRYRGQSFELTVPYGGEMAAAFHTLHAARHGHAQPDRAIEVVHLRLRAVGPVAPVSLPEAEPGPLDPSPARSAVGAAVHLTDGEITVDLFERERLRPGMRVDGPALVVEYSSTTWVPAGATAAVDRRGSLVMEIAA